MHNRLLSIPQRAALLAMLTVALGVCVGCPQTGTNTGSDNGGSGTNGSAEPPREPLFKDWQEPTAVLVLTGDQHGYLEPCGCSEKQSGGFARRADMFRMLREEKGWNVVGLDVGGTLKEKRAQRTQSQAKFAAILTGLNHMGYQALAVGFEELLFGTTNLYTSHLEMENLEGFNLKFLSANITLFGTKEGMPPASYRIIETGGLKLGVTSVISPNAQKELDAIGVTRDPAELLISPIDEVLPGVMAEMQQQGADLLVLLVNGDIDEAKSLAEKYPQFQLVVTARSAEDPLKETMHVGNTLFCEVGQKGKNAAVVGIVKSPE
ncbi:MAG: hypothetical protein KDA58_15985, partial [Planctomycetaceae bacterium]|nr:hypothetical protein [Planctomycetaceae bacterium]